MVVPITITFDVWLVFYANSVIKQKTEEIRQLTG